MPVGIFFPLRRCPFLLAHQETQRMPQTATLSFDLLKTFVILVNQGGDAARAMRELGLNQPTMSKRLRHLQHAGTDAETAVAGPEGETVGSHCGRAEGLPSRGRTCPGVQELECFSGGRGGRASSRPVRVRTANGPGVSARDLEGLSEGAPAGGLADLDPPGPVPHRGSCQRVAGSGDCHPRRSRDC